MSTATDTARWAGLVERVANDDAAAHCQVFGHDHITDDVALVARPGLIVPGQNRMVAAPGWRAVAYCDHCEKVL